MAVSGFLVATVALYLSHVLTAGFVYQDAFAVSPVLVHSLSLALHLLNGTLLFLIVRKLELDAPVWIAGIFLIHPLNIEAVAYGAAQSELIILGSVLLLIWAVLNRWWVAVIVPVLALGSTKIQSFWSVLSHADVNAGVAQGVSYLTWWRWEATAAIGHLGRWIVPIGLSNDHDVVHVPIAAQTGALVLLIALVFMAHWTVRSYPLRWAVVAIVLVLIPRFLVRVPLSILNEHHWYPVTVGLSMLTVAGWRRMGAI